MFVKEEKKLSEEKDISGVKKDKYINIVNVDDLNSDDEPIEKRLAPSIAKRLRNRTGKDVASTSKPSKAPKKSFVVIPAKGWSKVVAPAKKMKEAPSSDSEYNIEQNVQDIMPLKKVVRKKVPANMLEVPIDNISFHSVENVEKLEACVPKEVGFGKRTWEGCP